MSSGFDWPGLIGGAIGISLVAIPMYFRKSSWIDRARRLALKGALPLPPEVEFRVARWIRSRATLSTILGLGGWMVFAVSASSLLRPRASHPVTEFFTAALFLTPAVVILYGLVISVPAWNSKDRRGTAHLTKPRVGQTFTVREWAALGTGCAFALGLSWWFLGQTGNARWWWAWPLVLGVSYAAWWRGSRAILERSSRAANDLELQWDDFLRYKQVREFTIGAAWGPAAVAGFVDAVIGNGFPVLLGVLAGAVLIQLVVFRDGQDLWRRSWTTASS